MRNLIQILFGTLFVFGLSSVSKGQVCNTGQTYVQQGYTYQTQQYVQPTTYTYQYQTVNYPVVVGVPLSDLGINYYFSVSPERRESRIVEQVTKELLARMNANGYGILVPLQDQPTQPGPVTPPQPVNPNVLPPVVGTPQPDGSNVVQPQLQQPSTTPVPGQVGSGPGALTPAAQSQLQVLNVMQNKCMKCHKPGEIKKDVKLFNADGSLFDNDLGKRMDVLNSVLHKEGVTAMPPDPAPSLTSDEKRLIMNWVQESIK